MLYITVTTDGIADSFHIAVPSQTNELKKMSPTLFLMFSVTRVYLLLISTCLYKVIQRRKSQITNCKCYNWKVADSRSDEVKEFFLIYLILSAALRPEVYSASNINEHQEQKNYVSGE
jgi:hypothetical protein